MLACWHALSTSDVPLLCVEGGKHSRIHTYAHTNKTHTTQTKHTHTYTHTFTHTYTCAHTHTYTHAYTDWFLWRS